MAEEIVPTRFVDAPEEALSPREVRLEQGAAVLRWGAIINGGLAILGLVLALLAGVNVLPNFFPILRNLLLARFPGADDAALAAVILLVQLNVSFLLVIMVGLLARETWALIGVWVLVAMNIAAL